MLSSANKDCSSFLTSAQRQHRCGEGETRWRIQGTAANDGHVRVEGWKARTVSTKEARVALATPASLLGETIDQNRARLPGKRGQIHVSR